MRISTSWAQQLQVYAMQNQQTQLNKTQMQLSTGLKMLTPSDDPIAATKALSIQTSIAQTAQYQENINTGKTSNALESSTLSNMVSSLQRARDLAVQSLNSGALNTTDKRAIGQEIQQILGNMTALTNTSDANGKYIFSGYQSNTPPYALTTPATATTPAIYTYQGGSEQRMLQVDNGVQIAAGDPGAAIFEFSGTNLLNTLSNFANTLANPNPTTDQAALTSTLNQLDVGIQQISNTQAKAGARLNALDIQSNQTDQYLVDMKSNLSGIQDLDYAEAISRFNQQQTTLQAAQQSFSKVQKLSLFDYL